MFFRAQRDHHAHAQNGIDEEAAQIGAAFPHEFTERGEPLLVMLEDPQAGRHQHHAQQEEPPVQAQHDDDTPCQEHDVAQDREQGIGGDALHFAHVVIEARHQVAQTEAGVEARGKRLQMAEQRETHVEQHRRRYLNVAIAGGNVHQEPQQRHTQHEAGYFDKRRHVARYQRSVNQEFGNIRLKQVQPG